MARTGYSIMYSQSSLALISGCINLDLDLKIVLNPCCITLLLYPSQSQQWMLQVPQLSISMAKQQINKRMVLMTIMGFTKCRAKRMGGFMLSLYFISLSLLLLQQLYVVHNIDVVAATFYSSTNVAVPLNTIAIIVDSV